MLTLAVSIQNQIMEDIFSGALQPGMRLEEKDLAGRYDVSRTPVREALRHLAATGVVEFRPHMACLLPILPPIAGRKSWK